jgi:polyferredoxin
MNTKYFLLTGEVPQVHPAAMFLLLTFLAASFLLRKAFCSWLCPVGTLSEWLWKLGRDTFKRNFLLPRWLDIGLRSLKYILLGLFLYAVASMSATAIGQFLGSPYGLVADVKMLDFFRFMGMTAAVVVGVLSSPLCSSRTSGAATCALTAHSWAWPRCFPPCASAATRRPASTAPSAPKRALRACPWIS